jgi:hypothetical protein
MLLFFYLYTLFAFVQANNSIYKITNNNYKITNNNYKITDNNYNENTCKFKYNNTSITGHNCSITNGTFLRYCYDYTKCISNQSICNEKIFEDQCILMLFQIRMLMIIFYILLFVLSFSYLRLYLNNIIIRESTKHLYFLAYVIVLLIIPIVFVFLTYAYFLEVYGTCMLILLINFIIFNKKKRIITYNNPHYSGNL